MIISPKNRTVYNFRGDLIKALQAKGFEVLVTGPDQTEREMIDALGVRFVELPMNKTGTDPLADLRYCLSLWKLIRKERPDRILAYTVKPVVYGGLAARLAGHRHFYSLITGGGYIFAASTLKARLLGLVVRTLYRASLSSSRATIFQNDDDRQEFIGRGLVKGDKTRVVAGSGVNLDAFPAAPMPADPSFLMVSRLLGSKGVMEYLQAAALVRQSHPHARFALVGQYEDTMQDALSREAIDHYFETGIVARHGETDDVRPFYRDCGVYVLPSYREGTPRTVLEAMATGRPVITTDTNGCRDTVQEGVNGFLVPPRDARALAERMSWCLQHPDQLAAMGEASRRLCEEQYDVHLVNRSMLDMMGVT